MPRQKYEREIAEILERLEQQGSLPQRRRRAWRWPSPPGGFGGLSLGGSSRAWLALVIGLPVLGALVQRALPALGAALVLAGIAVFLAPLVLALVGGLRADRRPLWRGRVIEMPYRGSGLAAWWRYQIWLWRQRWERRR